MDKKPKQISEEAIERATGHRWNHWLTVLKKMDAAELPHKEIARRLYDEHGVPGWWCQMLTVRFEQETGRRKAGQRSEGNYSVGVSTTIAGKIDDIYELWQKTCFKQKSFNNVALSESPSLSQTNKWRYWKARLVNNIRILVNISEKSKDKVILQVETEKLQDEKAVESWRKYWKEFLQRELNP